MIMEQIVRGDTCSPGPPETSHPRDTIQTPLPQRKRGRPKGSRNRNKTEVELSDTLKQIQTLIKALLKRIDALIPVRYLVLDGYFGHNNALMWCVFSRRICRQRKNHTSYCSVLTWH